MIYIVANTKSLRMRLFTPHLPLGTVVSEFMPSVQYQRSRREEMPRKLGCCPFPLKLFKVAPVSPRKRMWQVRAAAIQVEGNEVGDNKLEAKFVCSFSIIPRRGASLGGRAGPSITASRCLLKRQSEHAPAKSSEAERGTGNAHSEMTGRSYQ